MHFPASLCMLQVLPISRSLMWSFWYILVKNAKRAPHTMQCHSASCCFLSVMAKQPLWLRTWGIRSTLTWKEVSRIVFVESLKASCFLPIPKHL
jgi:hypothetical protein